MRSKACIVGGGVIGGGWAARFLLNGWDVAVFDTDPEAERKLIIRDQISNLAPAHAVIGSSTSGFKPSELAGAGIRVIVAHPFNPVYLLPLVELVGDIAMCERASAFLSGTGMYLLIIRKEIDAHIADRLLEAVWRESLWLVKDGIATTAEIAQAIRMGFGLRWAQMGLFETYRIASGEADMKHFIRQFGPALE